MKKTELLAPAKNKETAFAAIDCGADAVYIGASGYGARRNAANSIEDIKEVVDYAHKFWAKVYVTVNTILDDIELDEAVRLINELDKIGVDAVLIQDMGLLEKIIQASVPSPCGRVGIFDSGVGVSIHASTQCDNRDIEKVKFFKDIGLSRVVLAREISIEQINKIHKEVPDIELESFVHGALCVSYSGQCYLSQYIGGRSANRGECAQPCRKKYTILDDKNNIIKKDIYALCLKDFNASNQIKNMIDAGVFSFKIEGRLKDIGYVKNVVSYYRQELDKYSNKSSSGKSIYLFTPDVEKTFNRGYTEYFLNNLTDCYNFVSPKSMGKCINKKNKTCKQAGKAIYIETNEKLNAQDGLCFIRNDIMEGFLINKVEKHDKGYLIYPNKKINIKENTKLYRNLDTEFEKELLKPTKRQIGVKVFVDKNVINIIDEDNVETSVSISSNEPAKNQEKMNETFIRQFSKTGETNFYIEEIKIKTDVPFMPVSEINELRRSAFDALMQKRLELYKREGQKSLHYAKFYKKELDYRANIYNESAHKFYEQCGCSVKEYCPEKILPNRQIELMRTKHCIKYALNMCKAPINLFLQDEEGVKYPLKFDCKNCEMVVQSPCK